MGTAFIFLANSAIQRISKHEIGTNTKALMLTIETYQLGTKTVPEQKALLKLHEHVDITKLGFDKKELEEVKEYVERMTAPLPDISDSSDDDDSSSSSSPSSAAPSEDNGEETSEDDDTVFPPGLEKGSDVPGLSSNWGFKCELCGHICIQTRHFYAHFKEGRGIERLRIFRAMKAELVWWAKDPQGNEYTGELVALTEKPNQPAIPPPCGDRIRAANLVRSRQKRDKALEKKNAGAGQRGAVAGTKRKRV
jgi:hypothetical protein